MIRLRIASGSWAAAASEVIHSSRRFDGTQRRRVRRRIPLSINRSGQILLRAVALVTSWATGLLVAAWVVPGVSLSVPGFIVAVVVFAVTQAILSFSILELPHWYVPLLLGGTGLALTFVALILASVVARGLSLDGMASWLATTVVIWLMTTIGAITLPELLIREEDIST